jgi:hypothetical protein
MAKRWKIRITTAEATTEVAFLFQNEDVEQEVRRILRLLAEQADPRQPSPSAGLIVDELAYDTPGWFRVKVPRYGIRLIFRLIVVKGEAWIEVKRMDPVPDDQEEYYLEIMQAGYRKDVYGEELRRRYRTYRQPDE